MRLPHQLLELQWFVFTSVDEFIHAMGPNCPPAEIDEIRRLSVLCLPPVSSREALSTMLGLNTGLIWSLEHRTHRYYRNFMIPKGKGFRQIAAPKIALKIIQKWIATQLERLYSPQEHVFGFVAGRSHIAAASKHCGARWVLSLDIKDFFPSTPQFVILSRLYEPWLWAGWSGRVVILMLSSRRPSARRAIQSSSVKSSPGRS